MVSKNDPHHINVVYHIYEGPQVYTHDVLTLGRQRTQQRLIDRDVATIVPNQPLTETELLTAESQLYNHTGVFDWAEVDPQAPDHDADQRRCAGQSPRGQEEHHDLRLRFRSDQPRWQYSRAAPWRCPNLPPVGLPSNFTTSQTTYYGPRGTFQYTRNNVRGKGESLSATAFAGRLDQRVAGYYIVPNFRWSKWGATTSILAERDEENPDLFLAG